MRQHRTMRQSGRGTNSIDGRARGFSRPLDPKRVLDVAFAAAALVVLSPLILAVALAVRLESRGPVFFRCRRVGLGGATLSMLKFRKMRDGVAGSPLTAVRDDRFTRIGSFLAKTKLDELPQLWNVLRGQMSLVGPRPEDPSIVELRPDEYTQILCVRPGITGLSQLAFANEAEILADDYRVDDYLQRVLPEKMSIDRLYVERRSLWMDLRILAWTLAAVVLRKRPAVHRANGRLTMRAPRSVEVAAPVSLNAAPIAIKSTRGA